MNLELQDLAAPLELGVNESYELAVSMQGLSIPDSSLSCKLPMRVNASLRMCRALALLCLARCRLTSLAGACLTLVLKE